MELRAAIPRRVSNSMWGMGNSSIAITAHALIESLFNYGLTAPGSAFTVDDLGSIDKKFLDPVAGRVTAAGYSARREIIYPLADIGSARNHCLRKVANVLDRMLRAKDTQAQKRMLALLRQVRSGQDLWKPGKAFE